MRKKTYYPPLVHWIDLGPLTAVCQNMSNTENLDPNPGVWGSDDEDLFN